jgi:hypothetical protein
MHAAASSQRARAQQRCAERRDATFASGADPFDAYLREVGIHRLLTAQEEVEIAKRLEAALRERDEAVVSTPVAARETLELDTNAEAGEVDWDEILDGDVREVGKRAAELRRAYERLERAITSQGVTGKRAAKARTEQRTALSKMRVSRARESPRGISSAPRRRGSRPRPRG